MFQFDDFSKNEFELPRTRILPDLRYQHGDFRRVRRHSVNDLYTDEDLDETIAAQEKFLDAVGFESGSVLVEGVGAIVGKSFRRHVR
jgi:hypothetical protein